jgi:hypothetical protein
MSVLLKHPEGEVLVEELPSNRRPLRIRHFTEQLSKPQKTCETDYGLDLIQSILDEKSPLFLCRRRAPSLAPG